MQKVINSYKPIGVTPLELIHEFKEKYPEYKNAKIGYAGRLDPMAEGILLLLIAEENLKRKEYEILQKEYEFTALYGIETDSYDILGMVQNYDLQPQNNLNKKIIEVLPLYLGKQTQPYPPYSSPRVNGKPLFYWAREGKINEIKIPEKEIEIYDLQLLSTDTLNSIDLQNIIFDRISKVKGEFRQKEILEKWKEFFQKNHNHIFYTSTIKAVCSSGTYIRSLTHEIGKKLGCGAIALNIKRTQVGEYTLNESIKL